MVKIANTGWAVCIATSSLARNRVVEIGGAILLPISVGGGGYIDMFLTTLSMRLE